jgi:hypothetical protein
MPVKVIAAMTPSSQMITATGEVAGFVADTEREEIRASE